MPFPLMSQASHTSSSVSSVIPSRLCVYISLPHAIALSRCASSTARLCSMFCGPSESQAHLWVRSCLRQRVRCETDLDLKVFFSLLSQPQGPGRRKEQEQSSTRSISGSSSKLVCSILGTDKLSLGSTLSQGITQGDTTTGIFFLGMSNQASKGTQACLKWQPVCVLNPARLLGGSLC